MNNSIYHYDNNNKNKNTDDDGTNILVKRQKLHGNINNKKKTSIEDQNILKFKFSHLNTFYTFLKYKTPYLQSISFNYLKQNLDKIIGKKYTTKESLTEKDVSLITKILNYDNNKSSNIPNIAEFKYIDKDQYELDNMSRKSAQTLLTNQSSSDIFKLEDTEGSSEGNDKRLILVLKFKQGNINDMKQLKSTIEHRQDIFNKNLQKLLTKYDTITGLYNSTCVPQAPNFDDPLSLLNKNKDHKKLDSNDKNNNAVSGFIFDYFKSKEILHVLNASPANYSTMDDFLPKVIQELLKPIDKLYIHQKLAIQDIIEYGKNCIVTTSTSSGKSLIYQISTLLSILKNPNNSSVLYISPTKALAQDQQRSFQNLLSKLNNIDPETLTDKKDMEDYKVLKNLKIATYDGDTDIKTRRNIRKDDLVRVIFTNPDMLHASILPNHVNWRRILLNLKLCIIDELHIYTGLFGTHVSFVLRRLRRLLYHLGNGSQLDTSSDGCKFIGCSATLRDPNMAFQSLLGLPSNSISVVTKDGSPRGLKNVIVWNPDITGTTTNGFKYKRDFIGGSARIIVELLKRNIKTIAFCFVRRLCELLMKEVRTLLTNENIQETYLPDVVSYRGGYSTQDRRKIEKELFHGNLKCVISTNALELGVDIGELDCVLMCGFPVSLSNFHQQSGRAGRRMHDSMTIVVASDNPVDQYYVKHSEKLVSMDPNDLQDLVIDLSNSMVLESHLQCAAFEFPITLTEDEPYFAITGEKDSITKFRTLCEKKLQMYEGNDPNLINTYNCNIRYLPWPAKFVSLRGVEEDMYAVVDVTNNRNVVIEEIEASRTSFTLYDGGIFIHQGLPYLVKEFNPDEHYAKVLRVDVDYITSQRDFTDVDPIEIEIIRSLSKKSDVPVYFGKIRTKIVVFGFLKLNKYNQILDVVETHNPPVILHSKGFWIDIPKRALELVAQKQLNMAGGIHAAQHAIISCLPQYIVTGVDEIQTECKAAEKEFASRQTERVRPARLIFYDSKGGSSGSGLSIKAFEHIDEVLENATAKIENCDCEYGCPSCGVAVPFCKENSSVLSKQACLIILHVILGHDPDTFLNNIKDGPEENMPLIQVETVKPVVDHVKFSNGFKIIEF
ncbi:related to Putative ATP-dependent helicase HRQ1 [Saccharomycodes ludwigii]|uniref:Related to Putative ATP-dependent helicase HRQ1 n=1 Tax=Saccharomycodes ludwigii TaxID=36035 RepID=A0A376B2P2_9ASCO|nr:hypothetical protein SCDLUD_004608 [Saccharomycodes ludwigii]KAH3899179.1 hypothetical protein SCDLUD_004608 [Saccharomycodes ludwigii]SSD58956.1 related to Putative ATP-dependent helicase HRQ1 [Saccharomycodes ludwigii]